MKAVKVGKIWVVSDDSDINKGTGSVKYFISGEGWKKGKIKEIKEIPDSWNNLNWYEICKLTEEYGEYVGLEYSNSKVAGCIAYQTLKGKYTLYTTLKEHWNKDNIWLLDILECEHMLAIFGAYMFDLLDFDKWMGKNIPEYDNVECTYKGEKASCSDAIRMHYGEEIHNMINILLKKA